jgi:cysteinyl-tRNA synthetase
MSKSLGNSVTVAEALQTIPAPVLRYALGAAHYRSTIEWSDQVVADATAAYARIETFVRNATEAVGDAPVDDALSKASWAEFAAAMDDDLGVPQALAVVHNGIRAGNALLAAREIPALAATLAVVRRMLGVLCLDPLSDWPSEAGGQLSGVVDALVDLVVEARGAARERKDYAQSDAIRDRLTAAGIVLEDTADGVRWRLS